MTVHGAPAFPVCVGCHQDLRRPGTPYGFHTVVYVCLCACDYARCWALAGPRTTVKSKLQRMQNRKSKGECRKNELTYTQLSINFHRTLCELPKAAPDQLLLHRQIARHPFQPQQAQAPYVLSVTALLTTNLEATYTRLDAHTQALPPTQSHAIIHVLLTFA